MPTTYQNPSLQAALRQARAARQAYREGKVEPTAGIAPGMTQANMIALPREWAWDFLLYAQRNPKPCPALDVIEAGDHRTLLAEGADVRTDIPLYRVWRDGQLVEEVRDARPLWQEHPDLVTFLIGCSFTFETPLQEAGIEVRHIEQGCNVPMYRTNIATSAAGPFHGSMVVSMRPLKAADVVRAVQITSRFPNVHGAPVHIGDPSLIGIHDLSRPDFGDAVVVMPDELPVFWACGVTPQAAIQQARPAFCITHAPGAMLITDLLNHQLASL